MTPGFLLLIAVLYYLDDGLNVLGWVVLAATLHEAAHICAALLFGGRIETVALSVLGAELRFAYEGIQPYWKENMIALAGPMANLLLGCVFLWCDNILAGIMSVSLGLFNLLPVLPLDGGRIVFNLAAEFLGLDVAEWIMVIVTGVCIGVLAGIGVIAMTEYANVTIVVAAIWLLFSSTKNHDKKFSEK